MGLIKNQQIEITNWLNSDRNYDDGVFLYQKYGKNPVLKRLFPGREKFQAEKLAYELGKLIGLGFNQTLESQEPDNKQVPDSGSDETTPNPTNTQSTDKAETFADKAESFAEDAEDFANAAEEHKNSAEEFSEEAKQAANETKEFADKAKAAAETLGAMAAGDPVPAGNYPPVINRIIAEFSRLYNERGMLKKQENDTPDENTPENIETRRKIIEKIESISARIDILYAAKKAYLEKDIVPDEKELYPVPNQQAASDPTDSGQLIIKRNNLRSSITRAKNQLEYQSQKKADKTNPMPDCPKRRELEVRIAEKEKELAEIEAKLNDADRSEKPE